MKLKGKERQRQRAAMVRTAHDVASSEHILPCLQTGKPDMKQPVITEIGQMSAPFRLEGAGEHAGEFLVNCVKVTLKQIQYQTFATALVVLLVRTEGSVGSVMDPKESDSRVSVYNALGGRRLCIHVGEWQKSHPWPRITRETLNGGLEIAFLFMGQEQQLREVGHLLKTYDPTGGKIYTQMVLTAYLQNSPCAPYTTTTINFGWPCGIHVDRGNWSSGYCTVTPVGEWRGCDLYFPQFDLALNMSPGDVCFFKSSPLWHGNLPLQDGIRFPYVYFADGGMADKVARGVETSTWKF